MCELCNGEKITRRDFEFSLNDDLLKAEHGWMSANDYFEASGWLKINFCPMCGRKLKGE